MLIFQISEIDLFKEAYECKVSDTRTKYCVICRNLRNKKEIADILSHIIPESVLRSAQEGNRMKFAHTETAKTLSYKDVGFRGFCKSCELSLAVNGENDFNPKV